MDDNSILSNIANDRDLDYPVSTDITVEAGKALERLAERDYGGNKARAVRHAIMRMLRQSYMLAE